MEEGVEGYTEDGTVDLSGNPVLRSKRGGWRACSFLVVYEVFERMAYYGIASNLVLYMTKKLHQGTVSSSNNVTNWAGTIWITPILGAYIADAHLGRYLTFIISSAVYLLGMILLTLAVSIPGLKPPSCTEPNVADCKKASTLQLVVFYGALYTLAVGTGGTKPNISTIGADQFDEFDPKEKAQKLSFFNWWAFSIFFGTLFATTFLVYIQDNVGWTMGYAIPTVGLAISIAIFLRGSPFYRHRLPGRSPFNKMARVIVAATRKVGVPVPSDRNELYEHQLEEYTKYGKSKIDYTNTLRFLNKAAVRTSSNNLWMLCTVTEVEETKQILRMIPILICTFIPSAMMAQANTLFVKQGTTLDRSIGPSFQIPPASLVAFITLSMLLCLILYDRLFVPIMRQRTKNPRGITLLQRMGIGLALNILIMIVASIVERKRLSVARDRAVKTGLVPMTIFILMPQFILMGTADAFYAVSIIEFFYDQAPEAMKSLGSSCATTTLGVGNFLSSLLLSTVSKLSQKYARRGWILNDLNASHLDYYYGFLAMLNFFNFLFFVIVAKAYVYKAEISDSMNVLEAELMGVVPTREEELVNVFPP